MSKSIKSAGKLVGGALDSITGKASYDTSGYSNLIDYLNNYDTKNTDTTLNNLTNYASNASNNLSNMGDYTFSVNASEDARKQAQEATYNSYMNYLQPQFEQQTSDLATSLQNKGLAVGSEAYNRAMGNLQDNQNQAINQAAYQSVLAGNDAYTQDLNNQINAGSFGNSAQQSYINQLLSALTNSQSSYDIANDKFAAETGQANAAYTAQQQAIANRLNLINSAMSGASKAAGGM